MSIVVYSFSEASAVSSAYINTKMALPEMKSLALAMIALQISLIRTTSLGGVL